MLKNLYVYRRYLLGSFWTDFRFRYAGTVLGVFWFVINPLLEATLYTVVFSQLLGARASSPGVPYILFLLTGLLPWMAFSQLIIHGCNSLNKASVYLRRLSIPTDVYVAKDALISMVSLAVYMVFIIPITLLFHNTLSWYLLILPVLILLMGALGFGISLVLAHLRVFFPDIVEVLAVLVQLWRWTLPVNFSYDIFPAWFVLIMKITNPPYYFLASFRDVIIYRNMPSIHAWSFMVGWVVFFGVLGSFVSRKLGAMVKDQM
jgi:ABC-type polysaccharide/polyol phosphate export permease